MLSLTAVSKRCLSMLANMRVRSRCLRLSSGQKPHPSCTMISLRSVEGLELSVRLPVSLVLFVLHPWIFRLLSTTTLGTFACWNGSYTWLKKTGLGRFCLNRLAQPFHRQLTHACAVTLSLTDLTGCTLGSCMATVSLSGPLSSCVLAVDVRDHVALSNPAGQRWLGLMNGFPWSSLVILKRRSSLHVASTPLTRKSSVSCCTACQQSSLRLGVPETMFMYAFRGSSRRTLPYIPLNLDFTLLWLSGLP